MRLRVKIDGGDGAGAMKDPYKIGEWTVYPARNRLMRDGEEIVVEPRIVDLLNCFAAKPGEVLGRDFLIECAWDGVIVSESTINHTVGVLRRTLGDKARDPRYIETVAKKGYRLLQTPISIREGGDNSVPVSVSAEQGTKPENVSHTIPIRLHGWGVAGLVAGALLMAALLWPQVPDMGPSTITGVKPLTAHAGREMGPTTDPAGEFIYFSHVAEETDQADLYRTTLAGGTMEPVFGITDTSEHSPAISPDGKRIAYARYGNRGCEVVLSALDGTHEETLFNSCGRYGAQLTWAPDGTLYFAGETTPRAPQKIFKVLPETGRVTEVTDSSTGIGDYTYALSLDGSKLAYMRTTHWNHSDLRVKDLGTGEDRLVYQFATWFFDIAFDEMGKHIYFTADPNRHTLERINIKSGKRETVFQQEKSLGGFVSLPNGKGLVASQESWDMNIYQLQAGGQSEQSLINGGEKLVFSTRADWQPRLSPDGTMLAFLSDRTGQLEVWVSDREGRNARQISHLNGDRRVHVFDWAPDGKSFVFDADDDRIYRLDLETGAAAAITPMGMIARNPAFGPDSKLVVFTSDKTGEWQIWAQELAGGAPTQVTEGGGFSARFGPDKTLYFTKYYRDGLWRKDGTSGAETLHVAHMVTGPVQQWELTADGVYYLNIEQIPMRLMFSSWPAGEPVALHDIPFTGFTFELDPKGNALLFSREDDRTSDLVLLR